ncbi:hypothetical protein F5Y15DRAFT_404015 [Xylariaceae sp. FL0016]|nr:hypothetical protein F5Y15DRAFT_404015 [Xylariaceae sp. FL0016]
MNITTTASLKMAVPLEPALLELADSLTQGELPTKLRCAICSKLAVNSFRLPCCETAICDSCQSTLPPSCPVCEHSPVSGADCTIYKSLRTTIKVFLKTEEKRRETAQARLNGSTPTTPIQATPTPSQTQGPTEPPLSEHASAETQEMQAPETDIVQEAESDDIKAADPEQIHESNPGKEVVAEQPPEEEGGEKSLDASGDRIRGSEPEDVADSGEKNDEAEDEAEGDEPETSVANSGPDAMSTSFNMNFGGGDMNPMMMMAMQNGMNPAAFGAFPMMGMMDPMAMQNMMMSGGFGAQGMMNGMNMNMGMNGFNGGSNDWNGQQSWNVGQDNFNPNAPGMGNGDFGNFNANFRTGNYGHHNQFNDYRRGGYRGRGRGRGFYGGYGRGYHQGYNNHNVGWTEQTIQTTGGLEDQSQQRDGDETSESKNADIDEFGRTIRTDSGMHAVSGHHNGDGVAVGNQNTDATQGENHVAGEDGFGLTGESVDSMKHTGDDAPQGPANGTQTSMAPKAVPDVPLNAPTGPKAMRQGLPNTSLLNLKARGLIVDKPSPGLGTNAPIVASPMEDRQRTRSSSLQSREDTGHRHRERRRNHNAEERSREKDASRDRGHSRTRSMSRSRSPSRSRSRSRSRSHGRKESRRRRRHRSPSLTDESRDGEHRRRKHRSKRKSTREDKDDDRSRTVSPERERKRPSHRSHRDREEKRRDRDRERDRDRDRVRDRDRDRENEHDHHRKSTRRSHRDREDRERDKDRQKERDRDRERDRGKERFREQDKSSRDRDHHGRTSKAAPPTPVEPSDKGFHPPTGPRGSFSIKGASSRPSVPPKHGSEPSRRASQVSVGSQGQKGGKDPHTLEREARDRERLLREAARIAGLTGLAGRAGSKRSRDAGDDRGGRRKSRRSEAVAEDEEERMSRLEKEREGGRWE